MLETVCAAFGERVRPLMTAMLWGDPTLTDEDIRVAVVDDAIASVVRIADRPVRYGTATLRLAGIGAVSTHPDFQGHGLASRVLEDAARSMRERGFSLGMLFTGIPAFYARLGWAPMAEPGFRVDLPMADGDDAIADRGDDARFSVRPFDGTSDLPAVTQIYRAFNEGCFGPHLRSSGFWTCAHSRERHIAPALVAVRAGEVVAYASVQPSDEELTLYEAGCLPGAEGSSMPLAVAIRERASAMGERVIAGSLPSGHPLRDALQGLCRDHFEDAPGDGMMLLPLDVPVLRRLAASQGLPDWTSPLIAGAPRPFVYWWPDHF